MADMEMAEAYLTSNGATNNTQENRERIINYVLEKNSVTKEEYDSTINWYGRHFDKYDELYARVDKLLAARAKKVSGNVEEVITTDLWPYARRVEISPLSSSDNVAFKIAPTDNGKGDRINWKLNIISAASCTGMLGVTYQDGVTYYVTKSFSGSGNFEMNFQTDTSRVVKDIFGNLRMSNISSPIRMDSIRLESIPFDSTEYYRINSQRKYLGPVRKNKMILPKDSSTYEKNQGNIGA